MHGLQRSYLEMSNAPHKLLWHMQSRLQRGRIVILNDYPLELLKRIQKLADRNEQELVARLTLQYPPDPPHAISIATLEQLLAWAPECRVLYVTSEVSTEQMYLITAWMPKGGAVIDCTKHGKRTRKVCARQ